MPMLATRTRRKVNRTAMRRMVIPMIMQAMVTMVITTRMTVIKTVTITMTSIAVTTITTAIPMLMITNKPARPRRRAVVRADAIIEDNTASEDAAQTPAGRSEMQESEAAALYRLMTWLSAGFA